MANIKGAPTVAQVQVLLDGQASIMKAGWNALGAIHGVNAAKIGAVFGDGTAANPGLGNADWFAAINGALTSQNTFFRPDKQFKRLATGLGGFIASFDNQIKNYLLPGRSFIGNGVVHAFDAWLTRQNGLYGLGTPAPIPASVLAAGWTLTPAGAFSAIPASGSIPTVAAGLAPRVVITQIGANDWQESPPSAPSGQFAVTDANSAYEILPAVWGGGAVVAAGVTKLGVYRQAVGGTGGYFWDQDVPVLAGAAYPVITLANPDAVLRQDWQPPAWASCLLLPEAAALFALAYATSMGGGMDAQAVYSPNGMISAMNVAAGPANGFLGVGNTPSTSLFLSVAVTGAATATSMGGLNFTNQPAQSIQGFAGGLGIQARITSPLSGAATITIAYTYLASAGGVPGPFAAVATGALTATFASAAAGTIATFAVPPDSAGLPVIVTSVTLSSLSGAGGAGGQFVIEPAPARGY